MYDSTLMKSKHRLSAIKCPKQPPPPQGTAMAGDIMLGGMRTYNCLPGYVMSGVKFSHCNMSGQWTADIPKCEGD